MGRANPGRGTSGTRCPRAPRLIAAAVLGAASFSLLAAPVTFAAPVTLTAPAASRPAAAPGPLTAPAVIAKAPSSATLHLYVGCSTAASAETSHACTLGEQPGAFFESSAELEYEVCVTFPSANTLCPPPQMAAAGVLYVNPITTSQLGEHVVRWYVGGAEVASWAFVVEPAPVPPPEAPPTSPPPPAEVEPAITKACGSARARTRRLQAQLRRPTGTRQRRHLRTRLRHARAVARRTCA
jgi:hypothetical protein